MSNERLRLNCLVFGDENPTHHIFTVEIEKVRNVSILQQLIKVKKQPTLDHVAPDQLVLQKVSIAVDNSLGKVLKGWPGGSSGQLLPLQSLGSIFVDPPDEQMLHILVTYYRPSKRTSLNEIWDIYLDKSMEADKELIESCEKGIDVMLVYSALFSGVVSAFILQSFPLLRPDPTEITNDLLREISGRLQNQSSSSSPGATPFNVSASALWINGLWCTSLICSLIAAFFSLIIRHWVEGYKKWMSYQHGDNHDRARLRHFRYVGISDWWMFTSMDALPLILQFALLPFLAGVVIYIARSSRTLAVVFGSIFSFVCIIYMATLILPFIFVQCPYQTLPTRRLEALWFSLYGWTARGWHFLWPTREPRVCVDREDREISAIHESKDVLDALILVSLLSNQGHQFDKCIIEAIADIVLQRQHSKVGSILLEAKVWQLVEGHYYRLLQLHPRATIDLAHSEEAYSCLKTFLFLAINSAVPPGSPSQRIRDSLQSLERTKETKLRLVVRELIRRYPSQRR